MRPKYKIVDEYVFYFLNAISRWNYGHVVYNIKYK